MFHDDGSVMLDKREIIGLSAILGVFGILAFGAYAFGVPFCLFHHLTGIPCPLCGTTRACVALLHGDVVCALKFNPLAVMAVLTGPFVLWIMTRIRSWTFVMVIAAKLFLWLAVLLNWAYLIRFQAG